MKNLFILCLIALNTLAVSAQTLQNKTSGKLKLEEVEVKDSAGIIYPADVVRQLMAGGDYRVRFSADHKTGIISKLTPAEINKKVSRAPKPPESQFFTTGEKIASFNERDIDGNKHNLKELAGKVVVLNFWFINCPPCRAEIPHLNKLVDEFKDSTDVVFIAIALDEKYAITSFLKANPYKYAIIDRGRYIADKYGIHLYPTHVVLDKQGKVLFHTSGLTSGTLPWLKKSIEAGLNNAIPSID